MIIDIKGVNFVNKGAELMLHAVLQQMATWDDHDIHVAIGLKGSSFAQRRSLGLHHLAWLDSRKLFFVGPVLNSLLALTPAGLRRRVHWVRPSEVDVILDASGFAYSDQFGPVYPEMVLKAYRAAKQAGQKIVLLPQAFGPFENQRVATAVAQIIALADLVYARDEVSYGHLVRLNGRSPHLKIAPDFTNLVKPANPGKNPLIKDQPCIIPNSRMLEKTETAVQANYLSFLAFIIEQLQKQGFSPFILVHESQSDYPLAQAIQNRVVTPLAIVQEADAMRTKGIIGQASLVVSSRYHGLISGLSQGVPSLATGWSHKYEMLMAAYGCPEWLVSPTLPTEDLQQLIDMMVREPERSQLVARLQIASEGIKTAVTQMWTEIQAYLLKSKTWG